MRALLPLSILACSLGVLTGCSYHLDRTEARQKIDSAFERGPDLSGQLLPVGLPGLSVDDTPSADHFELGLIPSPGDDGEGALYHALADAGYIRMQEAPATRGNAAHQVFVTLTSKAGGALTVFDQTIYDAGFRCMHTDGGGSECQLPPLLEVQPRDYRILHIAQDGDRARVKVMVALKLSQLALDLKPFVDAHGSSDDEAGWQKAIRDAGLESSAVTVFFKRFNDGWRVVDQSRPTGNDAARTPHNRTSNSQA